MPLTVAKPKTLILVIPPVHRAKRGKPLAFPKGSGLNEKREDNKDDRKNQKPNRFR